MKTCACGDHLWLDVRRDTTHRRCRSIVLLDHQDAHLLHGQVGKYLFHRGGRNPYFVIRWRDEAGKPVKSRLHREIVQTEKLVDHISGDGLDNRRVNLREATFAENSANSRGVRKRMSRYKGVRNSRGRLYYGEVVKDGKTYRGPGRKTEREAAADYDNLALQHFGEFARTNAACGYLR